MTITASSSLHRVCPQCSKVAALGRRFCGGCRTVLVKPCAACGFANERDDVWCGGCGAGLQPARTTTAAAPSPAPAARPPAPPPPPPARIHAVALERSQSGAANVADLLAINARRSAPIDDDLGDQQRLDELFGERR